MATLKWPKKLKVGPPHADRYGVDVNKWLGGDTLTAVTFTPPANSGITVSEISMENGVASALFSATIVDSFDIELEYRAGPRADCCKVRLTTVAGC